MKAGLGLLLLCAAASGETEGARRWWSHVQFLADDKLEGRAPGTEGHTQAARYVAKQFDLLALKPAIGRDFFQPVGFKHQQLNEQQSLVELVRDGVAEPLTFGQHLTMAVRGESGRVVEAGLVFVGHGLRIPEMDIDDLAGLDLKGKIAVVLRGALRRVPGPMAAHAQSTGEQWKNLRSRGALGLVTITHPKRGEIPWERTAALRHRPALTASDTSLVDTAGQQVSIAFNAAFAEPLFAGSGRTAAEMFTLMDENKDLPRFALKTGLRAKATFTSRAIEAENVLAVLAGADPKLRGECIVFSAHIDHVGKGSSTAGDNIYNGAMDNASGVATLIEVARALHKRPLKRTVVFAAVTGEESGLYGSKYLAAHPVPGLRVVANLNTDMFLPIIPLKAITVLGLDESDLGGELRAAAARFGIEAKADPQPQRNGFIRSDQYSFIRRGIPSIALKFFAEPGTPEGETLRRWLSERYHGPGDDLSQPVELESAVLFNQIVASFLEGAANRSRTPSWAGDSFFRRYSTSE